MNFAKTISGVATGAVTSIIAGFAATAIGLAASFAIVPAATFGAATGLVLSLLNHAEPQSTMTNAFIGGGLGAVAFLATTAGAAATLPAAAVAVGIGVVVGWACSVIGDALAG